MFLTEVTAALAQARIPYALVGGYAVALHGAVRGTVDVDLVIRLRESDLRRVERVLNDLGLRSRLPLAAADVFAYREEYIRNRNLTAWSFVNGSRPSEIVDVILTHDVDDMQVTTKRVRGRTVRVASIADLIEMKKDTGRPQDREDVRVLEKLL